jgi:hypothetical protein
MGYFYFTLPDFLRKTHPIDNLKLTVKRKTEKADYCNEYRPGKARAV